MIYVIKNNFNIKESCLCPVVIYDGTIDEVLEKYNIDKSKEHLLSSRMWSNLSELIHNIDFHSLKWSNKHILLNDDKNLMNIKHTDDHFYFGAIKKYRRNKNLNELV